MAFHKPAGLLVIPSPKKEKHTLTSLVNQSVTASSEYRLHPCHRLDRDTSGVILFAKGKKNQQILMQEFQRRRIKKHYIAFVNGRVNKRKGEITSHVRDFGQRKFQRNVKPKLAMTQYSVALVKKSFSVVDVYPLTGRTNQIRIQFAEIGHPVVGDRKYAFARDYDIKFRRAALHASEVSFRHPVTKKAITIKAPLAEDMQTFLKKH